MKIYQTLFTWIKRTFCSHVWKRLKYHGLPNEPNLVECVKCEWITKDKFWLPQMYVIKSLELQNKEFLEVLEEAESWFHDVRGYFTDDIRIEFDETCEKIKETIQKAKQ